MRNYFVPLSQYRYNYLASSAAANTITVFVAALEDAEFLCTVVSDTGTCMIISPQAPLQIIYYHHHGTAEAQHGAMEAQHGAVEAHQVTMEAHHGAMEAHQVTMEAHHGAMEAHQGAMEAVMQIRAVFFRIRIRPDR
jgi:hypothetical protein